MKTYKGFSKDMTCRGFQYKESEEYEQGGEVVACSKGFHACEYPLDCFRYYSPENSVYHEVEQSGKIAKDNNDTKIASSKIKIGARLDIAGLVNASIEWVREKIEENNNRGLSNEANSATGDYSANSATGDYSANSATGDYSANSATGYASANSATGNRSANSATGNRSANSATGDYSANSATGDYSANSATGNRSANSATGNRSANSATGYASANVTTGFNSENAGMGEANISVGWGKDNKCKGKIGSYLVVSEWGDWDGTKYPLVNAKMVKIDGEIIKEDTFYTLINGELVEVD